MPLMSLDSIRISPQQLAREFLRGFDPSKMNEELLRLEVQRFELPKQAVAELEQIFSIRDFAHLFRYKEDDLLLWITSFVPHSDNM